MNDIKVEHLNSRLDLVKKEINGKEVTSVVDSNPPLVIIPFIMDSDNKVISQIFLHDYIDIMGDPITSVISINQWNFDTNIDVIKTFISKFFSIPDSKIDLDRIFYLGVSDVNISMFKSSVTAYGVNLTGLLRDDEVKIKMFDDDKKDNIIRVPYYDILKGHYLDNMVMSTTFQLMSYFML